MKKLKFFLSLLMLFTFSVGTMWAKETATISFSGTTTTNMTGGNDAATVGLSASSWSVVGAKGGNANFPGLNKNGYIAIYYNATASNTITVTNTDGATIDSITVNYVSGYENGVVKVNDVAVTKVDGRYPINASSFVITNGNSTNVQVRFTSIVITYIPSVTPTISFKDGITPITQLDFGNVEQNQGFISKTFTLVGANLENKVTLYTNGALWSVGDAVYNPDGDGNINQTVTVYLNTTDVPTGNKDSYLYAEWADDPKPEGSKNDTILLLATIIEPPVITPGTYTIGLNNTFFGTSEGVNIASAVSASQDNISVTINGSGTKPRTDATYVRFYQNSTLTIAAHAGYVIKEIVYTYGSSKSDEQGVPTSVVGSVDGDNKTWTGSANEVVLSFASKSFISSIEVTYAVAPAVETPVISGQTPFYPTTTVTLSCETDGAEIHYTTNGDDPTGGDNTYSAPFTIDATKTVKAIAIKGVNVSEIVSKTFTKGTPISVTDAIALIPDAGNTENDQFVVGYVCTAGESVSSGQMTYYISDDGTTDDTGTATTDRLQIYKGKNLNNTDFSAASDLAIGDKVVVYGQLKNFSGTYEFNSGNYIVERVAKGDVASVAISGTATHGAYEGGDAFDPAGLTVTATYASGFQEDVTASATWSPATITTQSGNTDVTASFGGKTSAAKTVNISLNKYTVTFNTSVVGGTWGIQKAGEPISSGNHFPKGTVLTVVTNPVAGYTLGSITVNDEPLVGNEITIGTENITVAVEFAMVQEGVLVLSAKSLDWGTITAGTSSSSVPSKTFTLTGSNLTEGRTVKLTAPDWCYLTQTTANPTAGGNIATTSFYVYVKDATLETAGNYSGNIVISSDDLTADSLIAVSLNVVEATPSISVKDIYAQDITSIDFGNVDKGASVSQFSISLVGHNLTGDVKVTVANATSTNVFVTNGFKPSGTYSPSGGEIDAAVYVIPYTSTGGEFNGTITFHSESGDFDDIVIPLHINIKPDAGLTWSASSATAYTKAKPYELPTLTNPHSVTVAYSGSDDDVATVNASTGEVTLVAAGEVTITASFAGNGDYVAQEVDYTLTVKAPTGLRLSGEMTTKEYEEGDHVNVEGYTVEAVFGSPSDYYDVTSEATWKLDGVDIATKTVTSTAQYNIEAAWQGFTAWEYVNLVRKTHAVNFNSPEHGNLTVKVGDDTFLSGAKFKKGTVVTITISPASGYEGSVTVNDEPLVGNSYTIGTEDINIVATFNKVPVAAGLEWSATSADVRKGGSSNEFPTLTNPNSVEVTYESSDESIATINATTGAISLLANGSTTIKAIFAGNEDYLAATVSYTLNVSAGIVTITPNPVALDLGSVVFGDDRAKYGQSFHLNITNMISGQYNQVSVNFTGNAFWTAGNNYITDNDKDGVIDVDVTIVPSEYWWTLSESNALGVQNTTITLMCTGSAQFEDVVAGTATMTVVESATALDDLESGEKVVKVLDNGVVYIIRDGARYNLLGEKVK
ncbi:MAG: chitobiase/beta-hexosaminidase C-terminal domain-containing protein [Paludibacteraceae bacterium]|nr:chitobiase/beta-hexosaminidase C-terminal domain-containing protein [Paludibacteraceae bacterium]